MALVMYIIAVVLGIVAGALPAYGRGYQRGRREERALWMAQYDKIHRSYAEQDRAD